MLAPCRDCDESGHCDIENEKAREALHAWAFGGLVGCELRIETGWNGIEGVAA